MFYGAELEFLCDVMKKSHIHVAFAKPQDSVSNVIDKGLLAVFGTLNIAEKTVSDYIGKTAPCTVYKFTDTFKLCYMYFLLEDMPQDTVMLIGPYLHSRLDTKEILEVAEKKHLLPKNQKMLEKYYSGIPVVSPGNPLFTMLSTLHEKMWGRNNFSVIDIDSEKIPFFAENTEAMKSLDDTLININLMEKRYSYENELMQAVMQGQIQRGDLIFSSLSEAAFEKRTTDPLRNMKNYCIIMNTLFRKAAENGGVQPIHLDKLSSALAVEIEQVSRLADIPSLMREIFSSYCRLVQNHSMKNYSSIVQKTILFIESDLSANLTLSSLANVLNVSGGYLSTIFKKETGKTVTEYIRDRRIKQAAYLLCTTQLQIQTIAQHCGIMDVQYFSKIFKKQTGKTPKEYRETMKNN